MGGIIVIGGGDESPNEYDEEFADKTIEELIVIFNKDQPCQGWASARGRMLAALRQAFLNHSEIDCSTFISKERMEMNYQIRLEKNVIFQFSEEE